MNPNTQQESSHSGIRTDTTSPVRPLRLGLGKTVFGNQVSSRIRCWVTGNQTSTLRISTDARELHRMSIFSGLRVCRQALRDGLTGIEALQTLPSQYRAPLISS